MNIFVPPPSPKPRLLAIGTANPPKRYTQSDMLKLFQIEDRKIRKVFTNSHIASRYLCLPEPDANGKMPDETPEALLQKHKDAALDIGKQAIAKALHKANLIPKDIDYFVVASTTGLLCPALTALLAGAMGMRPDVQRADIVGMGCHAGLNMMQSVVNHCAMNPSAVGLMLSAEICSAMYVMDGTINAAIVNSLFGDGAAAAVISTQVPRVNSPCIPPEILGFSSYMIPETLGAMRIEMQQDKFAFWLEKQVPYVLGRHVRKPVDDLLNKFGLKRRDISHWIIHSGGRKVIDSIKYALNITEHDVRHTTHILRHYGNVSSGSFLFSYQNLLAESSVSKDDFMLMMTMGPGATIECGLSRF